MDLKRCIIYAILCTSAASSTLFAQTIFDVPSQCAVALKQDLRSMSMSTSEQLAYLGIIDQQTYEKFTQDGSASASVPIEGVPVPVGADYKSFDEQRKSFYQSVSYNYSEAAALNLLSQTTSARAYKSFDNCMNVMAQQNQGFYAWRVSEDQNDLTVDCQYHSPPAESFPRHIVPPIEVKLNVTGGVFSTTKKTSEIQKLGAYDHCTPIVVERTNQQKITLTFSGGGYNAIITSAVAPPPDGSAIISYIPLKRVEDTASQDMANWNPPMNKGTNNMDGKGGCWDKFPPEWCSEDGKHMAFPVPFTFFPPLDGDLIDPGQSKITEARDVNGDGGAQFCGQYHVNYSLIGTPPPNWPAEAIAFYGPRAGKHEIQVTARCWSKPVLWTATVRQYHMVPGDQVVTSSSTFREGEDFILSVPTGTPSKIQLSYLQGKKADVIKAGDASGDGKIKCVKTFDFRGRTFYVYHYAA